MNSVRLDAKGGIVRYTLKNHGKTYEIKEYPSDNDKPRYTVSVWFSRTTSKVFGNGSRGVEQSGWRGLPYNGATRNAVLNLYLWRKKHGKL